jgi:hypothetical protein
MGSSTSAPSTPSALVDNSKSIERYNSSNDPNLASSSSTSEKEMERAETSPRSFRDPTVSGPEASNLSRSYSASYKTASSASGSGGKRNSQPSMNADTIDEEKRVKLKKRYSGSSHINVHTECGRHTDGWLVGPLIDTVKDAVKTIAGGKPK